MFTSESWYEYLDEPMQQLVDEAYFLVDHEEMNQSILVDYAFVVFPMAKAYEGFLKKFFYDLELISLADFQGNHFRIGRSLNPDLPKKFQDEHWIYDDLEKLFACHPRAEGKKVPQTLWQAWRMGRNALFHYFPGRHEFIDLDEARVRLNLIKEAMVQALSCKTDLKIDSEGEVVQNKS